MATLRARLEQMYSDLPTHPGGRIGGTIAGAYNALLKEVSTALAGEDLAKKGIVQVTPQLDPESLRVLLGQLKLIAGDGV